MTGHDREELAASLETSAELSPETAAKVLNVIGTMLPAGSAWPEANAPRLQSTDEVIHLVDEILPDWQIKLKGRTNDENGHWTCTLRRSDRSDDDMIIGIGRGPVLSHAILAALVRLAGQLG